MKKIKNVAFSVVATAVLGVAVVVPVGSVLLNPTVVSAEPIELDYSGLEAAVARYNNLTQEQKDYINGLPGSHFIQGAVDILNNHSLLDNNPDPQSAINTGVATVNSFVDQAIANVPVVATINYTVKGIDEESGAELYSNSSTAEDGASVTETAQAIGGYTVTGNSSWTGTVAEGSVITFTYKKDEVTPSTGVDTNAGTSGNANTHKAPATVDADKANGDGAPVRQTDASTGAPIISVLFGTIGLAGVALRKKFFA